MDPAQAGAASELASALRLAMVSTNQLVARWGIVGLAFLM
jgi:hypothetical protein